MPVVFLIATIAVLVGIFFAATGRGGELAYEHADHAPLDLGSVTAADVALLRPPTALWGYNMQVTDAALDQIARAVRDRDVTIAYLQEQLASAGRDGSYAEPGSAHARQAADSALAGFAQFSGLPQASGLPDAPAAAEILESHQPADPLEIAPSADPLEIAPSADPFELPTRIDTPEPAHSLAGFWDWDAETSAPPETPASPEAWASPETPASPEAWASPETPASPETWAYQETPVTADLPETAALTDLPETAALADPPETVTAGSPVAEITDSPDAETAEPLQSPQTPLVLKASPASGPYDATEPAEILQEPAPGDATQPAEVPHEPASGDATQPAEIRDPTQPSAALAPDDTHGPQGDFNAHDWWAEQREAARQEDTTPEEQSW